MAIRWVRAVRPVACLLSAATVVAVRRFAAPVGVAPWVGVFAYAVIAALAVPWRRVRDGAGGHRWTFKADGVAIVLLLVLGNDVRVPLQEQSAIFVGTSFTMLALLAAALVAMWTSIGRSNADGAFKKMAQLPGWSTPDRWRLRREDGDGWVRLHLARTETPTRLEISVGPVPAIHVIPGGVTDDPVRYGDPVLDQDATCRGDEIALLSIMARARDVVSRIVARGGTISGGAVTVACTGDSIASVESIAQVVEETKQIARALRDATTDPPAALLAGVDGPFPVSMRRRCAAALEKHFPDAPETQRARALAPSLDAGTLSLSDTAAGGALSIAASRGTVAITDEK